MPEPAVVPAPTPKASTLAARPLTKSAGRAAGLGLLFLFSLGLGMRVPPAVAAPAAEAPLSVRAELADAAGQKVLRVTVKNEAPGTASMLADGRFLRADIEGAKGNRAVCTYPADGVKGARRDIPGGGELTFDVPPETLCFGMAEYNAWLQGGTLSVRYGAAGDNVAMLLPLADAKAKPKVYATAQSAKVPLPPSASVLPQLPSTQEFSVSATPRVDTMSGTGLALNITVSNIGQSTRTAWLRPGAVLLQVTGPKGLQVRCAPQRALVNPPREMFSTLGPKGSTTIYISADELCPDGTFDEPGLYRIEAQVDSRPGGGRVKGLETYDAVFTAQALTLLRRRSPSTPLFLRPPVLRP